MRKDRYQSSVVSRQGAGINGWLVIFFVLPTVTCQLSSVYASGNEEDRTSVMNAYGEGMELEFKLYDPGTEPIIDYSKYGKLEGVGTTEYQYKMDDRKGLASAVGEGIYPNNVVHKDPAFRLFTTKGRLAGSQWDYVNIDDQQLAFYKWASSNDTPAVQQFYTALALEKLGEIPHAIKAYQAVVIHFPRQVGWTIWHTPLYMSRIALDRIDFLTHKYPELGLKLVDADIRVENGYNTDVNDDRYTINPGRILKVDPSELKSKREDLSKLKVIKTLGQGDIQLIQYENHHWQLLANGKPFLIKAVAYSPTPVGKGPDEGYNLDDWMKSDLNKNGRIDGPFDSWVDKNHNNKRDPDEKVVGDFKLMKEMGVNTVRIYHHGSVNKELMRQLYKDYGIRVIMGDLIGMYAVASGADWYKGTDFTDPVQQEKMRESVRRMVNEFKDEPYILMWMLGNESNYGEPGNPAQDKVGTGSRAKLQPEAHYLFVNQLAGMIKSMDPKHLVAYSNGDLVTIDIMAKNSDNVDIFGSNSYRGSFGFGKSFWNDVKRFLDKPLVFTEYGCPAYVLKKDLAYAEAKQMEYHRGNWEDIVANTAGSGAGNGLGGVVFEFVDEWWKAGPPPKFSAAEQETIGQFQADFPDGWMHEEWLGMTGQGDGSDSPYMRQLRKSYEYYKKVWNE